MESMERLLSMLHTLKKQKEDKVLVSAEKLSVPSSTAP